jgi:hypothetical protein
LGGGWAWEHRAKLNVLQFLSVCAWSCSSFNFAKRWHLSLVFSVRSLSVVSSLGLHPTCRLYLYVVYFSFMRSTSVGTSSLLGRGKPHWPSQVQVVKWTTDLGNGLGTDMRVDLGRFGRTLP